MTAFILSTVGLIVGLMIIQWLERRHRVLPNTTLADLHERIGRLEMRIAQLEVAWFDEQNDDVDFSDVSWSVSPSPSPGPEDGDV